MKRLTFAILLIFLLIGINIVGCGNKDQTAPFGGGNKEGAQIMVSAAASLRDALEEIRLLYEQKYQGVNLVCNFASSGTLQQQIEHGSPVDIFISAGQKQMDFLEEKKLIKKQTRINLLSNELVLITGKDNESINGFADLQKAQVEYIGIGNPESVPVGMYAKEALISMKLWDVLQPKLVQAKDTRQVLSYVETGNAEAGLVYKSDAMVSGKIKIVESVAPSLHEQIIYPAAVTSSAALTGEAERFMDFLRGDDAVRTFAKYGFKVLADTGESGRIKQSQK